MSTSGTEGSIPLTSTYSGAGIVFNPFATRVTPSSSRSEFRSNQMSVDTSFLEKNLPQSIEAIFYVSDDKERCINDGNTRCFDRDFARTVHNLFLQYVWRPAGLSSEAFPLLQLNPADWDAPFSEDIVSSFKPFVPIDDSVAEEF